MRARLVRGGRANITRYRIADLIVMANIWKFGLVWLGLVWFGFEWYGAWGMSIFSYMQNFELLA